MTNRIGEIFAHGLCCGLGNQPETASAAYFAEIRCLHRESGIIGADGQEQLTASIWPMHERPHYIKRLRSLFDQAYSHCLTQLKETSAEDKKFELYLALPAWLKHSEKMLTLFKDNFEQNLPENISNILYFHEDHAGGFLALANALNHIQESIQEGIFVCGLDSYMAHFILDMHQINNQLIDESNPYGMVPGEAAGIIFVSHQTFMETGDAIGQPLIISTDDETEKPGDNNRAIMGKALVNCLNDILPMLPEDTLPGLVMGDLNGHRHRSEEYGYACASLPRLNQVLSNISSPALSIGDIGAATGIVMLNLALAKPKSTTINTNLAKAIVTRAPDLSLHWTSSFNSGKRAVVMIKSLK